MNNLWINVVIPAAPSQHIDVGVSVVLLHKQGMEHQVSKTIGRLATASVVDCISVRCVCIKWPKIDQSIPKQVDRKSYHGRL